MLGVYRNILTHILNLKSLRVIFFSYTKTIFDNKFLAYVRLLSTNKKQVLWYLRP